MRPSTADFTTERSIVPVAAPLASFVRTISRWAARSALMSLPLSFHSITRALPAIELPALRRASPVLFAALRRSAPALRISVLAVVAVVLAVAVVSLAAVVAAGVVVSVEAEVERVDLLQP